MSLCCTNNTTQCKCNACIYIHICIDRYLCISSTVEYSSSTLPIYRLDKEYLHFKLIELLYLHFKLIEHRHIGTPVDKFCYQEKSLFGDSLLPNVVGGLQEHALPTPVHSLNNYSQATCNRKIGKGNHKSVRKQAHI